MSASNETRSPWQIEQGKKCSCRGSDDYCPCQNVDFSQRETPTPEGQTEGAVVSEAIKHLRAMSHVAPRSFEVEAAFDFLARHDAALASKGV